MSTQKQPVGWTMQQVLLAASSNALVYIQGERGSGREFTARLIHQQSLKQGEFIVVDCTLYKKHPQPYLQLMAAANGTLVPKNSADLSTEGYAQVMDILQQAQTDTTCPRLILCGSKDASDITAHIRPDIIEQLKVVRITLTPLRERMEDFPSLIKNLLGRMHYVNALHDLQLDDIAYQKLNAHNWHGNIKELESVLLNAAQTTRTGVIQASHIRL